MLQPLPVPDHAWVHISMDFIEQLPLSARKDIIWVVVDRFTKYSHFIALAHTFTASSLAFIFLDNIYKLHGLPQSVISNRDKIFTSQFWQHLFQLIAIDQCLSTAYHPQSDGQTERVNQCLESYLRCMCSANQKRWSVWLPMAELWYNTSYHTSLGTNPFEAFYGFKPTPWVGGSVAQTNVEGAVELIRDRGCSTTFEESPYSNSEHNENVCK